MPRAAVAGRAAEPCIDGRARTAEQGGELGDLALFEVAQHQHFAVAVGELLQRRLRCVDALVGDRRRAGRWFRMRGFPVETSRGRSLGQVGAKPTEQPPPQRCRTLVVQRLAQRDPVQPRRPLRFAAETNCAAAMRPAASPGPRRRLPRPARANRAAGAPAVAAAVPRPRAPRRRRLPRASPRRGPAQGIPGGEHVGEGWHVGASAAIGHGWGTVLTGG